MKVSGQFSLAQSIDNLGSSPNSDSIWHAFNLIKTEMTQMELHQAVEQLEKWKEKHKEKFVAPLIRYHVEASHAYILLSAGQYEESAQSHIRASKIAKEHEDWVNQTASLSLAGHSFNLSKNIDSALHYVELAIAVCKEKQIEKWLRKPYIVRSDIYRRVGQFEDAKKTLLLAYHLPETDDGAFGKNFLIYTMIELFYEMNDLDSYAEYTSILIERMNQNGKTDRKGHYPIRQVLLSDESDESVSKLIRLVDISDEGDNRLYRTFYITAMSLCEKLENKPEGPKILEPILKRLNSRLEQSESLFWGAKVNEKLSEILAKQGRHKEALEYQHKKEDLMISSRKIQEQQELAELEIKYDTEKKGKEILSQQLIIQEQKQNRNYLLLVLGILLTLTLGTWIIQRNKIKYQTQLNQSQKELQKKEISSLQKTSKLKIANAMINGQEAERKRIAQDLHDGLGGMLTTIKHQMEMLNERPENDSLFQNSEDLISKACVEVRRIAQNMIPTSIHLSGLKGALEDTISNARLSNKGIELEIVGGLDDIDNDTALHIFRIVQELINNALKHSSASKVLVQLIRDGKNLHVLVEDNGIGFDPSLKGFSKGMGLENITSRVAFINGSLNYESRLGQGTAVNINIPIKTQII